MNLYLKFVLITLYMVITYHIIALKYRKSTGFSGFTRCAKIFWSVLHGFIVSTNIFLYFWLILKDSNPVHLLLSVSGFLLFAFGLLFILWGVYFLRKAVFVPGNKLVVTGPYKYVRHPMYLGGIIGAIGIAMFAGSLLGFIYSFILAAVLSRIADAEEEDLRARFGIDYIEYGKIVPKLFPKWEEIERFLANSFVQSMTLIIINLIFFALVDVSYIIGILKDYLINKIVTATDIVALLTVFVLIFGVLFYAGAYIRLKEYRLKTSELSIKNRIAIIGAVFVASIIIAFVTFPPGIISSKLQIFLKNFLKYIAILSLMVIYFGYLGKKHNDKSNHLTLKMLIYDEYGNKKLDIKNDLELFDATDKDYRFKDKDGNELIIPIGQVQEIVLPKIDDTTNDTKDSDKRTV